MTAQAQPYHLDFTDESQLPRLFADADYMFQLLFAALADTGSSLTITAGSGITVTQVGDTVTISASGSGVTMPQVAARVALGI
jgi:hypothetical protein